MQVTLSVTVFGLWCSTRTCSYADDVFLDHGDWMQRVLCNNDSVLYSRESGQTCFSIVYGRGADPRGLTCSRARSRRWRVSWRGASAGDLRLPTGSPRPRTAWLDRTSSYRTPTPTWRRSNNWIWTVRFRRPISTANFRTGAHQNTRPESLPSFTGTGGKRESFWFRRCCCCRRRRVSRHKSNA